MLATVMSATLLGVEGRAVSVEVHVSSGLPGFTVVGLPDTSCRESRDRVRAALLSSGFEWPLRRVTVNLAPTSVPKHGSGLDLPIAVGLLVASGQLPPEAVRDVAFLGELGLDGSLRATPGTFCRVEALAEAALVVVPPAGVVEAALCGPERVRAPRDLRGLVAALAEGAPWPEHPVSPSPPGGRDRALGLVHGDMADVRGQPLARRALEVAAAGGHHLLLVGPPGAGKTMLACRLPALLPDLDTELARSVTRIHSAGSGAPLDRLVDRPPLRAPHHTATAVAVIGGGSSLLRPGEVSLAHGGVLFLDELGEFPAAVLDAMRQPLEEGVVRVARAGLRVEVPARFLLVAAMNPCPCGERLSPDWCRCSDAQLARYRRRVSGPLLDRFDLRVEVARPGATALVSEPPGESTCAVRTRVEQARRAALARGVPTNAALPSAELERLAPLTPAAARLLERWVAQARLSGRGVQRLRRVALTIADLAGREGPIDEESLAEAHHLRVEPAFCSPRLAG